MSPFISVFHAIVSESRYLKNLDWGAPRPGHPEGTVRAHIAEVERNLDRLRSRLTEDEYWKLRVLVHTHDTFKADAARGVPITDPRSHASLAAAFLAEYCRDAGLLAMVQYHDEPFALWRQHKSKGLCDECRFEALLGNIADWDLFLAFCLIDGCTDGKSPEPLQWLMERVNERGCTRFGMEDIRAIEN